MLKIDGIAPIIDNDGKDGRVHSLTLKSIFVISVQHLVSSLLHSPFPSPPLPLRAKLRRLPCVRISWASLNPSMFCFQTTHQWSTRANILCIGINICGKLEWKQRSWTWHHLIPEPTANGNFIGFGVSQWQQLSSSVKWRICFTKEKRRRTKKRPTIRTKENTLFSDKKSQRRIWPVSSQASQAVGVWGRVVDVIRVWVGINASYGKCRKIQAFA